MEKVLHLIAPELALVLDFAFVGEVFDDEDGLVGYFGFFDSEFEVFFFGSVGPMEADEFFEFGLQDFRAVGGAIP